MELDSGVNGGEAAVKDGHLRIYIGGLGGGITADDLKKTFSTPQLGSVESVEIIRTKGRSIAYLDFRPCSEKGLAKLFSTYNGCLWKGGKLRLEKAKEHYMVRMRREWEEGAQLSSISDECVDSVESVPPPEKLVKDHISDSTPLRIFFPKLRKVKPIPFKGSGKHKYSFQRVAVPPLPVHFCDCDEHSVPLDIAKGSNNHENEVDGIKEEEFDMMNSVLSKLLDRKEVPQPAHNKAKVATEALISSNSNDEFQVKDKADEMSEDEFQVDDKADEMSDDEFQVDDKADEMSDDDDLIINVVGRSNDNLITNNQELQHSQSRPLQRKREIQEKKPFQQANVSEPALSKDKYATEAPSPAASDIEMSDDDNLVFNVVSGSNNKIPSVDSWVQNSIAKDKESQGSQSGRGNGKRGIQEKSTVQSNKKRKVALGKDKSGELRAPNTKRDLHETSVVEEPVSHNEAAEVVDSGVQPSSTNKPQAKGFSWRDLVSGRDSGSFSISDVIPSEPPMVEKGSKSETQDLFDKGNQRNETSETKVFKTTSDVLPQMPKADTSRAGESTAPSQTFSWKHLAGGLDDGSFSLSQIVPESKNLGKQEQHVNSEPNPDRSGLNLNLSNSVPVTDNAKSSEVAFSPELHGKQVMPAKQTIRRAEAGEEAFTFKKSNASLKDWKIAKAALSRSRNKKTAKD